MNRCCRHVIPVFHGRRPPRSSRVVVTQPTASWTSNHQILHIPSLGCGQRLSPSLGHTRPYSALPSTSLKPGSAIYVSKSTNPYFNLTLEDWLFRHRPVQAPLLLLYRNSPCVVIGRNQNPWKEVNLAAAQERRVPWIRRRSGGGTVYHDLGNTNYSIHVARTTFDRAKTAKVIARAVHALGVDACVNQRNDICVGQNKISGSAYRIVSNRAYHHGTMLIATSLDTLGNLLCVDKPRMYTKGVGSVRSPVCNLIQYDPRITHDMFVDAVIDSFRAEYCVDDESCVVDETPEYTSDEYFRAGMAELSSWDWAYGQTPEFEYVVGRRFEWGNLTSTIRSKHGIILSCTSTLHSTTPSAPERLQEALDELGRRLEGKKYGFVGESDALGSASSELAEVGETRKWLEVEMNT